MNISLYQVDAFTSKVFSGNPAAVCPLDNWPEDRVLQSIAAENNLSETAFFVAGKGCFQLRWFTPVAEVDLCGHATLAAAWVLFNRMGYTAPEIEFETRKGGLTVRRQDDGLSMDFPSLPPRPVSVIPEALCRGLGAPPEHVLASDDFLAVFSSEEDIRALRPDMGELARLERRGVIVTAPGAAVDFVSRFFAPKLGIPEDPVTGSAHCELAPYWAERLSKTNLLAHQVSARGGKVGCRISGDRVHISGKAALYLEGRISF